MNIELNKLKKSRIQKHKYVRICTCAYIMQIKTYNAFESRETKDKSLAI